MPAREGFPRRRAGRTGPLSRERARSLCPQRLRKARDLIPVYHEFVRPRRNTTRVTFATMAFHVDADYPPPKTWQQFEELCADTYAADWSDPALQRYGRAGQAQHFGMCNASVAWCTRQ